MKGNEWQERLGRETKIKIDKDLRIYSNDVSVKGNEKYKKKIVNKNINRINVAEWLDI